MRVKVIDSDKMMWVSVNHLSDGKRLLFEGGLLDVRGLEWWMFRSWIRRRYEDLLLDGYSVGFCYGGGRYLILYNKM